MEKKELQEKYIKAELLNKGLEQLTVQRNYIQINLEQISLLYASLDRLSEGDSYSQVGEDIYIKSKITSTDDFLVNVGKRIFVKMNKDELKKFLEEKKKKLENALLVTDKKSNEMVNELQKISAEIRDIDIQLNN
ncbi:MAG: hypothetical protein B6U88_01175 [Candidatus Aenigmarchaeota archaeon ex4484_56]|nr:MAG: hypothetical protein B6U88_01175 [Candidatus Aenigmarchaeota archaeon ex4484_56]